MTGLFITFEGTEGGGKSTQIQRLAERVRALGRTVIVLREPGGTPIGEEIRHTLKHSQQNHAMTAEAELLLMNASRAQLVREVIRPALARRDVVLCDRFYDSTIAYQAYGRRLDLKTVRGIVDFAVGETRPDLTLLLAVSTTVSEARRLSRQTKLLDVPATGAEAHPVKLAFNEPLRDRMEEADRDFFLRVEQGYQALAVAEPGRIKVIDAERDMETVAAEIWCVVELVLLKS
ncbi:MAG: dTMP kinase [Verrucomicrobia bacterium]|nr:dTMP kinase [Verrucomicrobiota bacterium]